MKITGPDTRMIKIGANEWVHVRGDAVKVAIDCSGYEADLLDKFVGKRVLILELVE
jgi:hypothetical protein